MTRRLRHEENRELLQRAAEFLRWCHFITYNGEARRHQWMVEDGDVLRCAAIHGRFDGGI